MALYRVYKMLESDQLSGEPPIQLDVESDQEAVFIARRLLPSEAAEVWQAARYVGHLAALNDGGPTTKSDARLKDDNIWKSAFRRC